MINIIRTSKFAAGLLANANSLRIHSVYEKTINLITPSGHLLAIQAKGSPLSPISLVTDMTPMEMGGLAFTTGSILPVAMIDIKKAEIIDLSLLNLLKKEYIGSYTHCCNILDAAANIIASSNTNGFENIIKQNPLSIKNRNNSLILTTAYKKLLNMNAENLPQRLPEFIGLGTGLTPSGDDFICGALAALQFLDIITQVIAKLDIVKCEKNIKYSIGNTNTISQAFLSCALQRQYSEAVIQLFTNPNDIAHHTNSLHAIGHSSGIDTICGIYYILHMYL